MEGLNKLHLVHTRLLFIIAEMYKDGKIDEYKKLTLKQRVFQDDEAIFEIYDKNKEPE